MRETGTHNNEGDLTKYVDFCRDWINKQPNRNWVDEDHMELFEEEKDGFNQDLDKLLNDYVGSGRMPPTAEGNRTFYRLSALAGTDFSSDFTWGAWLDDDQDITFKWPGDEEDDPKTPIGYCPDKLISSTLLHSSAILKHTYSDKPDPVLLEVRGLSQGDEPNKQKVYIGYAPACVIDAISSVPNLDPSLSSEDFAAQLYSNQMSPDEWQRVVDVRRIRGIADFIDDPENFLFNPILLYVDRNQDSNCLSEKVALNGKGTLEVNFDFLRKQTEGYVDYVPKPELINDPRPFKIVDGQHRVRGLAMSGRGYNLDIPFVLIVGDDPVVDRRLIAKIFTQINTKSVQLDILHKLYLSYKFEMDGNTPSEDYTVNLDISTDDAREPTRNSRPQRRAYELAMLMASVQDSPLQDMIEFQRPAIKGRRRPYHVCVNAANWVAYVRKWFLPNKIYADMNTDEFLRQETMNFFKAFQETSTISWPERPRWQPGCGRGKPLLQFEGPFLSLLELFPLVVREITESSKIERPIKKGTFLQALEPLKNVDWLDSKILTSNLRGRTNTNIRHLVKWMITAIRNGVAHSAEDILDHTLKSQAGKGILSTPANVSIDYLSGVRWPGSFPVTMRVNLPAHTLGSEWNVRFNTDAGPVEFDPKDAGAVQLKDGQTQLTITLDNLNPQANSIEIDTRLYNGIGSTLTERETLPKPE
jgi:DGQHR domain-containing protein